jgi:GT2 family glycosyltransferase
MTEQTGLGTDPKQDRRRPTVRGKFLYVGERKFWIKGVTYGTFRPDPTGNEFNDKSTVIADFSAMSQVGINTVRTYTVPPTWLLDIAKEFGLRVMVGIPWTQHIAFLDEPGLVTKIVDEIRQGVRQCKKHPAVLCFVIGNEITASIVRWSGRRRVERFIRRLYRTAKSEDPEALITYVNFPSTEYLQLPFLDFICFNVYLESTSNYESYLARLHNLTDERPLVIAELGLDSLRNGEAAQARYLETTVGATYRSGCCGAVVYAWTDEWFRGGHEIEDWNFGLTTRARQPKPALEAVGTAFTGAPFRQIREWPSFTVVVCSFNGESTIRDTLDGLSALEYPTYDVIVVDDGSTDRTAQISAEYPVRVISTENGGLSSARNIGMNAATGDIVAYIDDDAYPDSDWLCYLALTFLDSQFAGVGGPNLAPPGDGAIAECVSNAPGGPVQVLLSDTEAEHIPGCNMAFRRDALQEINGFDPMFRAAGDDVDLCWRLQDRGHSIGFNPAAMVWHHRRNSIRDYWKQQVGYGKAEALLERKWPEKYNGLGHITWAGRLYGKGLTIQLGTLRGRVYQGAWGSAPFQPLYQPRGSTLLSLLLMPEWYLVILILIALTMGNFGWLPPAFPLSVLALAVVLPILQAVLSTVGTPFATEHGAIGKSGLFLLTTSLHLLQPAARLFGRLRHGLTLWRRRGQATELRLLPLTVSVWRETAQELPSLMGGFATSLKGHGALLRLGGDFDRWDLEIRGGLFGAARLLAGSEEHENSQQRIRVRIWPRYSMVAIGLTGALSALAVASAQAGAWITTSVLVAATIATIWRAVVDSGRAAGLFNEHISQLGQLLEQE